MDKLNFMIWNVRGLNDKARRDNLRKVVDDTRPAVVCLQETKLSYISERDVISFLGRDFTKFVFLSAQQTRGGILIAWRDGSFVVSQHRVHRHSASVLFSNNDDPAWWFTGVYGPTEMMRNWDLLRNSGKFELIVLDLGCWQEIST